MIGLNGYTISTGIVSSELNGDDIIAVPLLVDDYIEVGWIKHKYNSLSKQARDYIEELKEVISSNEESEKL